MKLSNMFASLELFIVTCKSKKLDVLYKTKYDMNNERLFTSEVHMYMGCSLSILFYSLFFQKAMFAKIKHKAEGIKDNYIVNP